MAIFLNPIRKQNGIILHFAKLEGEGSGLKGFNVQAFGGMEGRTSIGPGSTLIPAPGIWEAFGGACGMKLPYTPFSAQSQWSKR